MKGNSIDCDLVGIAILGVPKEYSVPPKKIRLAQCRDKTAEIELALRVIPLEDSSLSPQNSEARGKNSSLGGRASSQGGNISESSFRSIMEMKDFDKKLISPPGFF